MIETAAADIRRPDPAAWRAMEHREPFTAVTTLVTR